MTASFLFKEAEEEGKTVKHKRKITPICNGKNTQNSGERKMT